MLNTIKVLFNEPEEFEAELKREWYNARLVPVLRATQQFKQHPDIPQLLSVSVLAGFLFTKFELVHLVELRQYLGDTMAGAPADTDKVILAANAAIDALQKLAAGAPHKMEFAAGQWSFAQA